MKILSLVTVPRLVVWKHDGYCRREQIFFFSYTRDDVNRASRRGRSESKLQGRGCQELRWAEHVPHVNQGYPTYLVPAKWSKLARTTPCRRSRWASAVHATPYKAIQNLSGGSPPAATTWCKYRGPCQDVRDLRKGMYGGWNTWENNWGTNLILLSGGEISGSLVNRNVGTCKPCTRNQIRKQPTARHHFGGAWMVVSDDTTTFLTGSLHDSTIAYFSTAAVIPSNLGRGKCLVLINA